MASLKLSMRQEALTGGAGGLIPIYIRPDDLPRLWSRFPEARQWQAEGVRDYDQVTNVPIGVLPKVKAFLKQAGIWYALVIPDEGEEVLFIKDCDARLYAHYSVTYSVNFSDVWTVVPAGTVGTVMGISGELFLKVPITGSDGSNRRRMVSVDREDLGGKYVAAV